MLGVLVTGRFRASLRFYTRSRPWHTTCQVCPCRLRTGAKQVNPSKLHSVLQVCRKRGPIFGEAALYVAFRCCELRGRRTIVLHKPGGRSLAPAATAATHQANKDTDTAAKDEASCKEQEGQELLATTCEATI